jgi:hypothetical protein
VILKIFGKNDIGFFGGWGGGGGGGVLDFYVKKYVLEIQAAFDRVATDTAHIHLPHPLAGSRPARLFNSLILVWFRFTRRVASALTAQHYITDSFCGASPGSEK